MIKRVFYCAGPGNIIETHRCWKQDRRNSTEVSLTFSGQIEDFCRDIHATAYLVASHPNRAILQDGGFTLEHRPKKARTGIRYHLGELQYGLGLLVTAARFGADLAIVDSGCTYYFVLGLFRLFGIRVVPVLHNTLWPNGYPPQKLIQRLMLQLDSRLFWRRVPAAAIGVSPVCKRQIDQLRKKKRYPVLQLRAQFEPGHFAKIPPPPPHEHRPFQVMFVGRITRPKGVFDILDIAAVLEASHPALVHWEVCGSGPDFDELVLRHRQLRLDGVVHLRGWTSPDDQIGVYARSHACIVPTRSSFVEGMAMTAVEAILAGRPLITSPVVPALEVLQSACSEAKTDDIDSYCNAVLRLATDADFYNRARAACGEYQTQFYDRRFGLTAVLKEVLAQYI